MKTILYTLAAVLLIVGGFLIGERVANFKVPHGRILVPQSFFDSIRSLKPDTVFKIDTIKLESIVYRDRVLSPPESTPDSTVFLYTDSVVNPYARVIIRDWIKGKLINREIELTPYVIQKTINVPYPVLIDYPAPIRDKPPSLTGFGGVTIGKRPGAEIGISTQKYYIAGQYNGFFGLTIGRRFVIF